ncbi:MAG: hypothetical protein WD651_11430 [Acidimicrobiia bacterium]
MKEPLVAALILVSACQVVTGATVVIGEDTWSMDVSQLAWSSRGVPITIANATDEDQTFLVINLSEGAAEDLPLTPDGLLDLTMANVSFDATRAASRYGLVHPEGVGGSLPILLAGESTSITIGPSGGPQPGTYLVISGDPNAVTTGRFARFDIAGPTN